MRRLYPQYTYGSGPISGCYWHETVAMPRAPKLAETHHCDVAIIGSGVTGLVAALRLAEAGRRVAVLDHMAIGAGASSRNGGFCCVGGAMASDAQLRKTYGEEARRAYRQTEAEAVHFTDALIADLGLDVDRHSAGETELAHNPRAFADLAASCPEIARDYGVTPEMIAQSALAEHGLGRGFYGARTLPIGFALNPAKYVVGLVAAVRAHGGAFFAHSEIREINPKAGRYELRSAHGTVIADQVVIATNGYSSEDVPDWMAGRYLPAQSSVIVTRPMSEDERAEAGWHSDQMAFDSRKLLHYFRMLPEGRFLFGMRGGTRGSARDDAARRDVLRGDLGRLFPAWKSVEATHYWSGMVCLTRDLVPFVGPVPGLANVFAGFGYHGNGVAMGSYSGAMLAEAVLGRDALRPPKIIAALARRFPAAPLRRLFLAPAYAYYTWRDRA